MITLRTVSSDTQAVLLLCGALGGDRAETRPLTPGEYNLLAGWLRDKSLRPGDLLDEEILNLYSLEPLEKVDALRIGELLAQGGPMAIRLEQWLNNGFWVISRSDDTYPRRLKTVLGKDSPPLLFGIGAIEVVSEGGIAIVGSRNVDRDGAEFAASLAEACAVNGLNVISGGARGVDQISMAIALSSGGKTVGMLANDLAKAAVIGENREAITNDQLILVSPYHPGTRFHVGNAMARNKFIYALSDASVVVSSALEKGGTWQGATENLKKWKVPLYIRETAGLIGNTRLIEKGGMPFPQKAMIDPSCLIVPLPTQADSGVDKSDPYEQALPEMLEYLSEPRDKKSIVNFLQVTTTVANTWLGRAIEEGKVEKNKKPVRYKATLQIEDSVPVNEQRLMFD